MAIFNSQSTAKKEAAPFTPDPPPYREVPASVDSAPAPTASRPATASQAKESLIASDLTIEGKIEGTGHVRIAGRFKGDVNVQGDLTIEAGAKLTGGVRAKRVVIAGELEGNIEGASHVELLAGGVLLGDVKAGALTVAAGSRMRGQADFGWEDKTAAVKPLNGTAAVVNGMESRAAS
jgi:cytoskeletal protein CcmA (bactofilin family)